MDQAGILFHRENIYSVLRYIFPTLFVRNNFANENGYRVENRECIWCSYVIARNWSH